MTDMKGSQKFILSLWNAVLIIKDYHLLLLDYHLLGIVHGTKIIAPCCTLLELCWNGVQGHA